MPTPDNAKSALPVQLGRRASPDNSYLNFSVRVKSGGLTTPEASAQASRSTVAAANSDVWDRLK